MSLRVHLGLAISTVNRANKATPQLPLTGFDILLTQADDAIITQSGIFLVRQIEQRNIVTQDGFIIIAQDNRTLQVGT